MFLLFPALGIWSFESTGSLELQASSIPEAQGAFILSLKVPFLHGDHPFIEDNNITTVLRAELSPLSAKGSGELNWTPAAFFFLSGGGRAATGWEIPLGVGLGFNTPMEEGLPRRSEIQGAPGLVWNLWGAGTLQFDLEALLPGDWNHVLFQTRQEFRYSEYTQADGRQSWIFENDLGENRNGWTYRASYTLGYLMPLSPVLNLVGIMGEMEKNLYSSPGGEAWGEDLGRWIFSGLFNFVINPQINATLALQMRTRPNYGNGLYETPEFFYEDLRIQEDEGKRRVLFYRGALILTYTLW
ncbi:MAG: hypothetical protein FWH12_09525 [Treponema sp.]|nr:hypothetical protein [Treponema sp.]